MAIRKGLRGAKKKMDEKVKKTISKTDSGGSKDLVDGVKTVGIDTEDNSVCKDLGGAFNDASDTGSPPSSSQKRSAVVSDDCATPEKKSKVVATAGPPGKYYAVKLTTGYEIVSPSDINDFKSEWSRFILETKEFDSMTGAEEYVRIAKGPTPPETPIKSVVDLTTTQLKGSQETVLDSAIAALREKSGANRINILYRTNCSSHECVVLIECLNTLGKLQWNVKPEFLCDPLKIFPEKFGEHPVTLEIVKDKSILSCFENMMKLVVRDTSGGPDAPLTIEWTTPDKSKVMNFTTYMLATSFPIPVDNLKDEADEQRYIAATLNNFGEIFKKALLDPTFEKLHQAACPRESTWLSINGLGPKKGGLSFKGYVKEATIHVSRCDNLNRHVTQAECDTLMTILWKGRKNGSTPKWTKNNAE